MMRRFITVDANRPAAGARLPSGRDMHRYLLAALVAAVPCLVFATYYFGIRILIMAAVAFVAGAAVEIAFSLVRKKPVTGGTLVFAVLLTLMLPPTIPLWMVALASVFGTFFGKEVFGGTGHHIFSPVLLGKGFLMFSYPTVVKGSYFGSMLGSSYPDAWISCSAAILVGGIAMVIARRENLLVLAGLLFAAGSLAVAMGHSGHLPYGSMLEFMVADGFLFGACFLVCDPACSPHDRAGKLLYGMSIGAIAVLMRCFSNYSDAMMSAILMGNLFAPLVDALALLGNESEE